VGQPNSARKTSFGGNPLERRDSLTSVLSQHVYCCANDPESCKSEKNYGELSNAGLKNCKTYVQDLISTRSEEANKLGVPLFISEFGACSGSKTCAQELEYVVSMADAHALSWTYYQFKGFGDYSTQYGNKETLGMYSKDGQLDEDKFYQLSRTYA
jgi:endoglycosylceramidase